MIFMGKWKSENEKWGEFKHSFIPTNDMDNFCRPNDTFTLYWLMQLAAEPNHLLIVRSK